MTNHDNPDDENRKSMPSAPSEESSSLFDKVVPDGVRRGVESLLREGRLKHLVSEMKLPKEIVSHMMAQIDETKQAAVSAVGREVRLFLERTSLADELVKLLTQVSFQIKTEVRFVRNEEKKAGSGDKEKRRKGRSSLWPLRPVVTHQVEPAAPAQDATDDSADAPVGKK